MAAVATEKMPGTPMILATTSLFCFRFIVVPREYAGMLAAVAVNNVYYWRIAFTHTLRAKTLTALAIWRRAAYWPNENHDDR